MNKVRTMFSQGRNRYKDKDFDLDLTAITQRIYAMGIPADDPVQKIYRNRMEDVSSFFEKKHNNKFWVFNISGRVYDKSPFKGQVTDYDWEDHQTPSMFTLLEICETIHNFLEADTDNVIAVHCNAGKGRTGTLICCYLLYCGLAPTAQKALTFFGWQRYANGKGVTTTAQIRYVFYFDRLMQCRTIPAPRRLRIEKIILSGIPGLTLSSGLKAELYDPHDNMLGHVFSGCMLEG